MGEYHRLSSSKGSWGLFNQFSRSNSISSGNSKQKVKKLFSKESIENLSKFVTKRSSSFSLLSVSTPSLTDDESIITTSIESTPTTQIFLTEVMGCSSRSDSPISERDLDEWESVPLINRKLNRSNSAHWSEYWVHPLKNAYSSVNLRKATASDPIRPRYNSLRAVGSASEIFSKKPRKHIFLERCLSCCDMKVEARKLANTNYNAYTIKDTPPPGSISVCINCSEPVLQMETLDF